MRFVIHCALLLMAFVGLATVIDRWTTPPSDDDLVGLSVGQMQPNDETYAALRQADHAKNLLSMKPVMVLAFGLATLAVCRPSILSRRMQAGLEKCCSAKKGRVV
jgi:hypothetical protein